MRGVHGKAHDMFAHRSPPAAITRFVTPLACVAVLAAQSAYPDATAPSIQPAANAGSDLQQTVVSATRTAQPLDQTGSSISVVSGAELALQQFAVVSDALQQLPGVSVARTAGAGQNTSLFLRGADAGQSLVLIDGIRLNDPSSPDGAPVLGDLFVNNVARIEVLRGPQSTL